MRTASSWSIIAFGTLAALAALACKKKDEEPPPQQPYGQQPYGQQPYGQPAPGTQPAPGQPAPAQPAPAPAPAPQPQPTATQPAPAGGQMTTPGPLALPCQSDAQCMTHRCNLQFQKCAFPCATDVDCNPGNRCTAGGCLPAAQ